MEFYKVSEVAKILGISRQSVRKLPLPFVVLSKRKILIKKTEFDKFIESSQSPSAGLTEVKA